MSGDEPTRPEPAPKGHSRRHWARAAAGVSGATLAAALTGFLREMALARFFGTGLAADAYRGASQVPNLVRMLLGEGALSAALIPVLTGLYAKGRRDEAEAVASGVITYVFVAVATVCALGIIFAPAIVRITVPGFAKDPEKFRLVVDLARIMFPSVLFATLAGLTAGVLNSRERFFAPAVAPVLMNAVSIAAVFLFARAWGAYAAAWGFLAGSVLLFAAQVPSVRAVGYRYLLGFHAQQEGVRKVFLLLGPVVLSAATHSINTVVDSRFASSLGQGPLAASGYALRVWSLPVSLFAISLATVVYPSMSRHAGIGDTVGFRRTVTQGMRLVTLLLAPCSVGLMVLAAPILGLIYERGTFTGSSTALTASALAYYSIGLVTVGLLHIVNRAFYALGDTVTPLVVSGGSIVANYFLDWGFIRWLPWLTRDGLGIPASNYLTFPLGGIALATSLVSITSLLVLTEILRRRVGGLEGRRYALTAFKVGLASLLLGATGYASWYVLSRALGAAGVGLEAARIVSVGAAMAAGVIAYVSAVSALGLQEAKTAWEMFRARLRRGLPDAT